MSFIPLTFSSYLLFYLFSFPALLSLFPVSFSSSSFPLLFLPLFLLFLSPSLHLTLYLSLRPSLALSQSSTLIPSLLPSFSPFFPQSFLSSSLLPFSFPLHLSYHHYLPLLSTLFFRSLSTFHPLLFFFISLFPSAPLLLPFLHTAFLFS